MAGRGLALWDEARGCVVRTLKNGAGPEEGGASASVKRNLRRRGQGLPQTPEPQRVRRTEVGILVRRSSELRPGSLVVHSALSGLVPLAEGCGGRA